MPAERTAGPWAPLRSRTSSRVTSRPERQSALLRPAFLIASSVRRVRQIGAGDADRRNAGGYRHQPGGVPVGEGAQVAADEPDLRRAGGAAHLNRP